MSFLSELTKGVRELHRGGKNALKGSLATASAFFKGGRNPVKECFGNLMVCLFHREGVFPEKAEKLFIRVMNDSAPEVNAVQLWHSFEELPDCSVEEVVEALNKLPADKKIQFIRFAAAIVYHKDGFPEEAEKLKNIALAAGIENTVFQEIVTNILAAQERRDRMIRSGAGIAAALIVIAVFILTATLLRSVIFGLIFAYLLLPVEQYLERNWREKRGPGFILGKVGAILGWLPRKIASALSRRDRDNLPTPEQIRRKDEQKIIARATGQTFFVLLTAVIIFGGGIYALSSYYLRGLKEQIHSPAAVSSAPAAVESSSGAPAKSFFSQSGIQKVRHKLEELPLLKYLIERAEISLKDEQTRQELISMIWRRSGGVFSFLVSVMGFIGALVCDLLLTLFFGLLFLMKMAEFKNNGLGGSGNFAVKTILVSNWLPNVSEATLTEAQRILSGVFSRLRIWVRGYLTLVLIDSTVYTILFGILDVPFFPVLGIIAGCGILLPYVGPIFSCFLTLLVTYLAGDAGISQLVCVLCCYLVYNGIIEQFILYPVVIGESLGLTTLETIIVVLLGAIFAGIPGMILALPAASVIKYLVPQIYRFWDTLIHRKKEMSQV